MTRSLLLSLSMISLTAINTHARASALEPLAPYPEADRGFVRQVIHLEKRDQEEGVKVEILAGKPLEVDCNGPRLVGDLKEMSSKSRGLRYYRLLRVSKPFYTLMRCTDASSHWEFVSVQGKGFWLPYSSRQPIVIYVPKDFEVRYRLWTASPKTRVALIE